LFACVGDLCKFVESEELKTGMRFIKRTTTKSFASDDVTAKLDSKFVLWEQLREQAGHPIPFTGVPFMIIGRQILECSSGPAQKEREPQHEDVDYSYHHKGCRHLQTSRKLGCPAKIHIKEIVTFPQFQITSNTKAKRSAMSIKLRAALQADHLQVNTERSFVVRYFDNHQSHYLGPMHEACLPTDKRVMEKMTELARGGVRRVAEMKRHVKVFIKNDLFDGQTAPFIVCRIPNIRIR